MKRKDLFADGEYYHLYSRGNSKQPIFLDNQDKDRFIKLLYVCNSKNSINFREDIVRAKIDAFKYDRGAPIVSIGAWVLMRNHFHLLVAINNPESKSDQSKSEISVFMHKLLTAYSKYFNKKYERTGTLFESKFKSERLDTDEYLKYIFSYIHLNPVKQIDKTWKEEGIKDKKRALNYIDDYKWSSYLDYCGEKRQECSILAKDNFPKYFDTPKVFKEEITDWLTYSK